MTRYGGLCSISLLLLVLAPASVAAPDAEPLSGLSMSTGALDLSGPGGFLHVPGATGATFQLVADHVQVIEHTEHYEASTFLGDPREPVPQDRHKNHTRVDWRGLLDQETSLLMVSPLGQRFDLTVDAPSAQVGAPTQDRETADPAPNHGADAWAAYVAGMLALTTDQAALRTEGDFVLRFWAGSVGGSDSEGLSDYESGTFNEPYGPTGALPVEALVTTQEVYLVLVVQGGVLHIDVPEANSIHAYLAGPTRMVGEDGVLHGAQGTYDGLLLEGEDLPLESFAMTVDLDRHRILVEDPEDPEPEAVIAFRLPRDEGAVVVLTVAFVALLGAAAWVLVHRLRRPATITELLESMDAHAYRRVVRRADRTLRRTGNSSVVVMKAVALLALGKVRGALRFLEGLSDEDRPTDGMAEFLRAHALNELGHEPEARTSLADALGHNPALVEDLARFPRLRALLPDDARDDASGVYA